MRSSMIARVVFISVAIIVGTSLSSSSESSSLIEIDIEPDNAFSRGRLYYGSLRLEPDSGSLYVGAMNNVFRLWLYNVNDTEQRSLFAHKELPASVDDAQECRRYASRNAAYHCQNHVRLLFRSSLRPTVLICSTNAFKPIVTELDATTFATVGTTESAIGICSGDPDLNTTAIYVGMYVDVDAEIIGLLETGNPGNIAAIYSGIRTGLALENHLIYRPALLENGREKYPSLRSMYTDSKWLNEPEFVGSFDIGEYVYFFFRESAVEFENCGRTVYSRVARICKSDLGGKSVLRQIWSSFVKARLNCSLAGDFPFYFDQIQSVFKLTTTTDTLFYATMSTDGFTAGSAICVFSLYDINTNFDTGTYREQTSSSAAWLPTAADQIPAQRPGHCVADSRNLSDSVLHFAKSHLLMDSAVSGGRPLFVRRDVMLTALVVDVHLDYHIVFAASTIGHIYKVVHWRDAAAGGASRSRPLVIYRLPLRQPINAMQLLTTEFIYVAQDDAVSQLNTAQCERYALCSNCIADPYCSWNNARQHCVPHEQAHSAAAGWVVSRPDRFEQTQSQCDWRARRERRQLYPGDSVHLPCHGTVDMARQEYPVQWLFNNGSLASRHLQTIDGGLVSTGDNGAYECNVHGQLIVQYKLLVDTVNCQKPTSVQQFQSVYKEWCREFENYKSTMNKWQRFYEQNTHCANAPNFKIAEQKSTSKRLLSSNNVIIE